jgi:CheY-like chemotaxis protein
MSGEKILLVDDSAMRGAPWQMLESVGYAVAEAEDGLIALERHSKSRTYLCGSRDEG